MTAASFHSKLQRHAPPLRRGGLQDGATLVVATPLPHASKPATSPPSTKGRWISRTSAANGVFAASTAAAPLVSLDDEDDERLEEYLSVWNDVVLLWFVDDDNEEEDEDVVVVVPPPLTALFQKACRGAILARSERATRSPFEHFASVSKQAVAASRYSLAAGLGCKGSSRRRLSATANKRTVQQV
ncbi:hypothetical protein BC567DRAFT_264174 [Phyllosticta citribraziliensis]